MNMKKGIILVKNFIFNEIDFLKMTNTEEELENKSNFMNLKNKEK